MPYIDEAMNEKSRLVKVILRAGSVAIALSILVFGKNKFNRVKPEGL
jgi:hypothetical protein